MDRPQLRGAGNNIRWIYPRESVDWRWLNHRLPKIDPFYIIIAVYRRAQILSGPLALTKSGKI
jgi:hypothetical protein